jgi:TonB family protein
MLKSTGNSVLDDAAVNAFRKAKFKPKTKGALMVPISFTITSTES